MKEQKLFVGLIGGMDILWKAVIVVNGIYTVIFTLNRDMYLLIHQQNSYKLMKTFISIIIIRKIIKPASSASHSC